MRAMIVLALAILAAPAIAAPPPASLYAALPTGIKPRLSPDGSAIAMIGNSGGKQAFVIVRLDGRPPKVFSAGEWIPDWIEWKTPATVLGGLRTSWDHPLQHGVELVNRRMLIMAADGSKIVPVDLTLAGGGVPLISDRIVSKLPGDPDHILAIELDDGSGGLSSSAVNVAKIDVNTGDRRLFQPSRDHVASWLADEAGRVRGAIGIYTPSSGTRDQHRQVRLLARVSEQDSWHTVVTEPWDATIGAQFDGFDPANPDRLMIGETGPSGYRIIRAYAISTGAPLEIVAQASGADVDGIAIDNRLVGFETVGTGQSYHYFDSAWQHDARAITHAIGGGTVELLDRTADGKHVLAALHDGAMPTEYWLLDRAGPKVTLKPVINEYDEVRPSQVAAATWTSYPARDGMTIPALLTLPPGKRAGPAPFVVLPHGGPHQHDELGFDWMAQFLASRGYGVLQPQFRASTGFGRALYEGGYQKWGTAVMDDIADGAHAMVARHLADPARIAIVGASFGGYSALQEAVRDPGLYRAAAALAPVTDWPMIEGGMRGFSRKDYFFVETAASFDELMTASPVNNAEKINVPVLIVHGRRDFTVPVGQSELMVRNLRQAGKTVQAIYLSEADHYLSDEADRRHGCRR